MTPQQNQTAVEEVKPATEPEFPNRKRDRESALEHAMEVVKARMAEVAEEVLKKDHKSYWVSMVHTTGDFIFFVGGDSLSSSGASFEEAFAKVLAPTDEKANRIDYLRAEIAKLEKGDV